MGYSAKNVYLSSFYVHVATNGEGQLPLISTPDLVIVISTTPTSLTRLVWASDLGPP